MSQKIHLDEWQKEVLRQEGDILLCTGRRVGKTYILARKAVDLMAKMRNCPIVMVSLTEDQAMIIQSMALNYAKQAYPRLIGTGRNRPTLRSLHVNNNKMLIRPVGATGDGARGFEGGVLIVDEASRMPKRFWIASKPIILTTGGSIWMASTPAGKQGYFWEAFNQAYNKQDPLSRFKVFYITTEKVINNRQISPSWTKKQREGSLRILKQDKLEMSDLEYGQEYLGLFLEEIRRYFSDELIEQTCILERPSPAKRQSEYFMGVDIARMGGDESTFEIIRQVNQENYEQVENIAVTKTLTTDTEQRIINLTKQYDEIEKIYIDAGAGSLGVGVFDHLLKAPETEDKVVALNNRAIALDRDGKKKQSLLKEDLYDNLRYLMITKRIKLLNDENLKASLRSVQYGYPEDKGEQTTKILSKIKVFGSYTHIAEGLIRAAAAAKEQNLSIWVGSIRI